MISSIFIFSVLPPAKVEEAMSSGRDGAVGVLVSLELFMVDAVWSLQLLCLRSRWVVNRESTKKQKIIANRKTLRVITS